jgi:hypothetical protein
VWPHPCDFEVLSDDRLGRRPSARVLNVDGLGLPGAERVAFTMSLSPAVAACRTGSRALGYPARNSRVDDGPLPSNPDRISPCSLDLPLNARPSGHSVDAMHSRMKGRRAMSREPDESVGAVRKTTLRPSVLDGGDRDGGVNRPGSACPRWCRLGRPDVRRFPQPLGVVPAEFGDQYGY